MRVAANVFPDMMIDRFVLRQSPHRGVCWVSVSDNLVGRSGETLNKTSRGFDSKIGHNRRDNIAP